MDEEAGAIWLLFYSLSICPIITNNVPVNLMMRYNDVVRVPFDAPPVRSGETGPGMIGRSMVYRVHNFGLILPQCISRTSIMITGSNYLTPSSVINIWHLLKNAGTLPVQLSEHALAFLQVLAAFDIPKEIITKILVMASENGKLECLGLCQHIYFENVKDQVLSVTPLEEAMEPDVGCLDNGLLNNRVRCASINRPCLVIVKSGLDLATTYALVVSAHSLEEKNR